jgi:hypothetical protein
VLAATGKCTKTAGLKMYLVKREIGTERHKKIEEKVDNEGFEQDGSRRIPTFSNRRIHPVFGPPLTNGSGLNRNAALKGVSSLHCHILSSGAVRIQRKDARTQRRKGAKVKNESSNLLCVFASSRLCV